MKREFVIGLGVEVRDGEVDEGMEAGIVEKGKYRIWVQGRLQ